MVQANNMKLPSKYGQAGLALFLALVFLLVTTILGVTSLRSNISAEKMVRANLQRELALEAAETTLLEGEQFVVDNDDAIITAILADIDGDTCSESIGADVGGICKPIQYTAGYSSAINKPFDHWRDISSNSLSINAWSDPNKHRTSNNPHGLATAPRYIVEFMGYSVQIDESGEGPSNCKATMSAAQLETTQATYPFCTMDRKLFRITALATTGNNDETRVMLQSTYVTD